MGSCGSACEEKQSKIEQEAGEVGNKIPETALAEHLQTGDIPVLDTLVGPQGMLGDLMEMKSLEEDQRQAQELSALGGSAYQRFELTWNVEDLDSAINYWGIAVALLGGSQTERWDILSNLGWAYLSRFRRLGETPDLKSAIDFGAEAVSLTPEDHPNRPIYLSNLGNSYQSRFEQLGELWDLNKAIKSHAEAVFLTPEGDPNRPGRLSNLGSSYRSRFEQLGELWDLNKAIESHAEAVLFTPDNHPNKPAILHNFGNSYKMRFSRLGELLDLNKAIDSQARAVSLTPEGHPSKPGRLNNLGISYKTRFKRLGELSDLNKAIESQAQAVSLTPDDHPDKPVTLAGLGVSHRVRFMRLGELSHLNKAIDLQAQTVSLTPEGHPDRPGTLNNLGNSYWTRFERLGELSDLNKAIEYQAQADSLTPQGHPDRPHWLNNLGVSNWARFKRLGEVSDLNKAIESQVQAVSLTAEGHPDRPGYLSNLGVLYQTRFGQLGELSDLNKAIESHAHAVSLTPEGHPDKSKYLNNLGPSYMARFKRLGKLSELNKAIESQAHAVSLAPDDHPDMSGKLNNLGAFYATRFELLGEPSDLQSAESLFRRASKSFTGPPSVRFLACKRWAKLCFHSTMPSPLPAYQQAMSLVPQLVWIGTTIDRRYELVAEVSNLAAEAASYAISTGEYNLALEWIEAGHSIVWGQIAQLRSPFDDLSRHNLKLANDLVSIGRQLEHAGSRPSLHSSPMISDPESVQEASTHVLLALEWDRLLMDIREIPGFGDFLCPPSASRLLSAANARPVAVINIHESRCDALILQPDCDIVLHVPLTNFYSKDAISARNHVLSQVRSRKPGRLNPLGPLHSSLESVRSGLVQPVLKFLGYTRKLPVDQLPQLVWCTSGLLSFIPLHALRSQDESEHSTFDLVISSYTPTLSALLSSQSADPISTCGIVAVGQKNTPGLNPLPCTTTELAVIHRHIGYDYYLQLEGSEATIEQVLEAMDQFSWVHMACHGSQNADDPTKSAFHLHDGNLTLAAITKRSFTHKGLAFLSACQTATGDENMPDEAVHLAAGMLTAGYPSVIGTMWSIADEDGPEVADLVYEELLKDGRMDHTKSARALHRAVAQLRAKVGEENIARWAPFIHFGSKYTKAVM